MKKDVGFGALSRILGDDEFRLWNILAITEVSERSSKLKASCNFNEILVRPPSSVFSSKEPFTVAKKVQIYCFIIVFFSRQDIFSVLQFILAVMKWNLRNSRGCGSWKVCKKSKYSSYVNSSFLHFFNGLSPKKSW